MGMFFLMAFFVSLLLTYRRTRGLCLAILQKVLKFSSHCQEVSVGFLQHGIRLSVNRDNFTSYLYNFIPFISFSYLMELGHPCLDPDFRGSVFSFSLFT